MIGSDPNVRFRETSYNELREHGCISSVCFDPNRGIIPKIKVREKNYKIADGTCVKTQH